MARRTRGSSAANAGEARAGGKRRRRNLSRRQVLDRVGPALRAADPVRAARWLCEVELRVRDEGGEGSCVMCGRAGATKMAHPKLCARCAGNARSLRGRERPDADEILDAVDEAMRADGLDADAVVAELERRFAASAKLDWHTPECALCHRAVSDRDCVRAAGASVCERCIEELTPHGAAVDEIFAEPSTEWEHWRAVVEAARIAHPERAEILFAELGPRFWAETRFGENEPNNHHCAFCGADEFESRGLVVGGVVERVDYWYERTVRDRAWFAPGRYSSSAEFNRGFALCAVCLTVASANIDWEAKRRKKRAPRLPGPEMVLHDLVRALHALMIEPASTIARLEVWLARDPATPAHENCRFCGASRESGRGLAGVARPLCGRCISDARDVLAPPRPRG